MLSSNTSYMVLSMIIHQIMDIYRGVDISASETTLYAQLNESSYVVRALSSVPLWTG